MKSPSTLSHAIRFLTVDAVEQAGSGHPGMPLGMADVATVLFQRHMRFSPHTPKWAARDRFVLSAGHGSMLLYSLFYLLGYKDVSLENLKRFRQKDSPCAGHPEYGHLQGVEVTTGPLAQGLGHAVGMALAERLMTQRYGAHFAHHTYVMCGDGCLMEGLSHEVASFAGHHRLGRLIVLFDDNQITIDGSTSLSTSDDTLRRFEAYGWHVQQMDGHDPEAIHRALLEARQTEQPSLIACRTVIGYGAPHKAGSCQVHGSPLGTAEVQHMRQSLNWPEEPFAVPDDLLKAWRAIGERAHAECEAWMKEHGSLVPSLRTDLSQEAQGAFMQLIEDWCQNPPTLATRAASQKVLEVIHPLCPSWIGGSADLTPSNNTKAAWAQPIQTPHDQGHYVHYGVREHGMAAIMNGLTLHGSFRAFGGTFLVFSDYMRPTIRLSAMMRLPVIYVLTHDSIGVGEDGPTHQPIEHLWSLRLIPYVDVYRPADALETAECWAMAAQTLDRPSVLVLSRQALKPVRQKSGPSLEASPCARGGYILSDRPSPRCTLIATGSEVHLALDVQKLLDEYGIACRIVSMPCTALFDRQAVEYQQMVLSQDHPIFALEAGSSLGWVRYTKNLDQVFGIDTFGLSAPAPELFKHFALQDKVMAQKIRDFLNKS